MSAFVQMQREIISRVRNEMKDMTPLERLEYVAFAQKYERRRVPCYRGLFTTHKLLEFPPELGEVDWIYPLSTETIIEVQQEAIQYIQDFVGDAESPYQRLKRLDDMLLELGLMDDFDGIVEDVRVKARRLREYVELRLEAERESRRDHATPSDEVVGDVSEPGTPARWQHLARAVVILKRHSDVEKKRDFEEATLKMKDELGMNSSKGPGTAIWAGVHRLAKDVLDVSYLPDQYRGVEGFRRLVYDLMAGTTPAQPKEKQQNS